jgi:hypothetical protein
MTVNKAKTNHGNRMPSFNLRGSGSNNATSLEVDAATDRDTMVKKSGIVKGEMGLYAVHNIEEDRTLGWYQGVVMNKQEAKASTSVYVAKLFNRPWWIPLSIWNDGYFCVNSPHAVSPNKLQYINSSVNTDETANVRMQHNGEFKTTRKVNSGEELLMAYAYDGCGQEDSEIYIMPTDDDDTP